MAIVVTAVVAAFAEGAAVATIMTAISEVGLATSVIGAVTGSKDLMKIGGVLGLAGGIGGMANAAFGSVGDAALSTASDLSGNVADSAATTAAPIVDTGIQDALNGAQPYSVTPGGGDLTGSNLTNSSMPAPGSSPMTSGSMPSTQPSMAPYTPTAYTPPVADPVSDMNPGGTPYSSNAPVTPDPTVTPDTSDLYANETAKFQRQNDAYNNNPASGGWMDKLAFTWKSLSPQAQAELVKAGLSVPGGIQAQKTKQMELAQNQQKINNAYISSVPRFGIINSAKGS